MVDDDLRRAIDERFGGAVSLRGVPSGYALVFDKALSSVGIYAVRRDAGLWRIEDAGTSIPLLVAEGRLTPGRHGELETLLQASGLVLDHASMIVTGPDVPAASIPSYAVALIEAERAVDGRFRRHADGSVLRALSERFVEGDGPDQLLDGHAWIALGLFGDLERFTANAVEILRNDPDAALARAFEGAWPPSQEVTPVPALSSSIDAALNTAMRLGPEETAAGEWLEWAIASMRSSDGHDPIWSKPTNIARAIMGLLLSDLAGASSRR